ncbi:dienelactone hydrolase family protein [Pontiellaceae bacterium B12227]|nr:dienelactone hydrolase family protein [Pontiellaceae bacterium B12227]
MNKIYAAILSMALGTTFSVFGESVDYKVSGVTFAGHIEKASEDAPLVLLVHDWDGLTDYEVKRAGMLKALGYSVFAIDLYGKGVRPTAIADRKKCMGMLTGDRPKMRDYMRGALSFAKEQGLNTENCVAMGYCFGGTAVLELARSGEDLKGFASFHGGLGLPEGQDYSKVTGEYLIMHSITDGMDPFSQLAEGLEKAGVGAQLICYAGAPHGWTVFGSPRYAEKQDAASWNHFIQYLEDTLK